MKLEKQNTALYKSVRFFGKDHSRLSSDIDFGKKWLGIKVSEKYFNTVKNFSKIPIFQKLKKLKEESNNEKKWSELKDCHSSIYVPVLNAFIDDLKKLDKENPKKVARNLVAYLVGNKDFYKIIKIKNSIEIHAYNLTGELNLPFKNIEPKYKIPKVALPTKILDIDFKKNSKTTIIVSFDNDWVLSFRIHNASSRIEPSLKFDISLIDAPKNLFKNTLNIIYGKK